MKAFETHAAKEKTTPSFAHDESSSVMQGVGYEARTSFPTEPVQRKGNKTGLPDHLKEGVENLSGITMNDVNVHYNSSKPSNLQALAYAQGTDIHLGPGQEKHLPHEAWHVVQQKQGRVKETRQLKGKVSINEDKGLEQEADIMGSKAASRQDVERGIDGSQVSQLKRGDGSQKVIQRAVGFEFETGYKIEKKDKDQWVNLQKMDVVKEYSNNIKLTADENSAGFSAIEMVLDPPVQETDAKKFDKALETFTKLSASFDAIRPGKDEVVPAPTRLDKIKGVSGSSKYQVTPAFSGFRGNPQLTGGISYDKLISFLDETTKKSASLSLTDKHKKAKTDATQYKDNANDTGAISAAKIEVDKIKGSEQLKGLVAMLAMYLKTASAGKPLFNYAKLISNSFMARTDFGSMFSNLPNEDREKFIKDPPSFVTLVLAAAGLPGQGNAKVFERGVRKSDQKKNADYNKDVTTEIPEMAITRNEWLLKITLGFDMISSAGIPELKNVFMGLGALENRTDRVGNDPAPKKGARNKGKGIIIELRNMKGDQSAVEFAASARAIFSYLVEMNAGKA